MAWRPLVRQKVFFNSPPQASSSGTSRPRSRVCGRISARPAQHALAAFEGAHHRIVRAHVDIAIVRQEPVGHAREPLERFRVRHHDGFFAQVAAGHHQRIVRRAREQQVVQRRIGQHHAEGVDCPARRPRECRDAAARQHARWAAASR